MADKDGRKRTLSAQISQWEQQKLFSRHFQDSKYVGEKNTFFRGWWSDFSTKLQPLWNKIQKISGQWVPSCSTNTEIFFKIDTHLVEIIQKFC